VLNGQTPEYAGRAVAHLAADAGVLAKSGLVLKVRDLADEYGFTDIDGRRPEHD
jgi:dehydrogenase/reductase SDR family member 1